MTTAFRSEYSRLLRDVLAFSAMQNNASVLLRGISPDIIASPTVQVLYRSSTFPLARVLVQLSS